MPRAELPLPLWDGLADRTYRRDGAGEPEVRFHWQARPTLLPVWLDGRVQVVQWGSRDRRGPLPPTGWTWRESVERGKWRHTGAEVVTVPACYCLVGGVWYRVREGVRAVCVRTPGGPAAFVVVEPSTRYFGVMTRSAWMPSLVGETI